ncbi:MAG: ATP-binding protein [Acidobacteriota bacterium]
MEFTIDRLEELIIKSEFDSLVGEIENEWFECKGQPYQVNTQTGKRELAKDVSSFANINGGYILIGLKTKSGPTHFGDEVEKLRPLDPGLVDTAQYRMIIRDWIYPEIDDLTVNWIALKDKTNKGIVVIKIPRQKQSSKPFLIRNVLDEKKRVEIQFGFAQRSEDSSQHLSVENLQRTLQAGLYYERRVSERFDSLEALLNQSIEHSRGLQYSRSLTENKTDFGKGMAESYPGQLSEIEMRIEVALSESKLSQARVFILSVEPVPAGELKTIFQTSEGTVRKSLEDPPTLRQGGFALQTHEQARIIKGELIRVLNEKYKILDLYRDGTLIFAVSADSNFLAWASTGDDLRLNPVALIESVYNFLSLYALVLDDLKEKPRRLIVRAALRNMHSNGVRSYLLPYGNDGLGYPLVGGELNYAPDEDCTKLIEANGEQLDPSELTLRVVKEIYLWFGLEEDKIPYTKTDGDFRFVDPQAIKQL